MHFAEVFLSFSNVSLSESNTRRIQSKTSNGSNSKLVFCDLALFVLSFSKVFLQNVLYQLIIFKND